jgi:hypothetical protein
LVRNDRPALLMSDKGHLASGKGSWPSSVHETTAPGIVHRLNARRPSLRRRSFKTNSIDPLALSATKLPLFTSASLPKSLVIKWGNIPALLFSNKTGEFEHYNRQQGVGMVNLPATDPLRGAGPADECGKIRRLTVHQDSNPENLASKPRLPRPM